VRLQEAEELITRSLPVSLLKQAWMTPDESGMAAWETPNPSMAAANPPATAPPPLVMSFLFKFPLSAGRLSVAPIALVDN
jgi:hypothetical protein